MGEIVNYTNYTDEEKELLEDVYYADFETTTHANYERDGEVEVYMWGILHANGEEYYQGRTLFEFLRALTHEIAPRNNKDKRKVSVWFHNLKFDFSFIENLFLRHGVAKYKKRSQVKLKQSFGYEYVTTRDDMGNLYGATWYLGEERLISFKDSAKVFPTTISDLGPSVGLRKLDDEFDYTRLVDDDFEPSEMDDMYLYMDIEIMRRVMNRQIVDGGGERLTRTGYAFQALKDKYVEINQPDDFYPKEHGLRRNDTIFDLHFPATSPEEYQLLSRAYSGGIVYINPKYRNKEVGKTIVYDVNSEYPGAMIKHDFPIGEGLYFDDNYEDLPDFMQKRYPLYVQIFKCKFKLKEGAFPSLPKVFGKKRATLYSHEDLDEFKGKRLVLTSVDLKHFFKNYDVWDIQYQSGIAWESVNAPFKEYIDAVGDLKIESELNGDMVGRMMSKLDANGSYGKFAQKPNRGSKDSYISEDGVVRYTDRVDEPEAQQYFPMAIFIAAWARNTLLEGIYAAGPERVLYVDTDSIHLLGWEVPETLEIHDTKLGYWSLEGKAVNAKFLRDKTYAEEMVQKDGSTKIEYKIAGLNDEAKEMIDGFSDFKLGKAYPGVLVSRLVKGGTLLVDGTKYLTPLVVANPHEDEMKRHNEYMNA